MSDNELRTPLEYDECTDGIPTVYRIYDHDGNTVADVTTEEYAKAILHAVNNAAKYEEALEVIITMDTKAIQAATARSVLPSSDNSTGSAGEKGGGRG